MANRIIVDRIDGINHIFSDNGGNTLQAHGTAVMEFSVHATIINIIGEMDGNLLTEQDVIEFTEINNGQEQPVQIIKMTDYLEK